MDEELEARRREVKSLLRQNLRDVFTIEAWPWVQTISTLAFIILIWLGDPWGNNVWIMYVMFIVWIAIQLLAMYKTYESEKK